MIWALLERFLRCITYLLDRFGLLHPVISLFGRVLGLLEHWRLLVPFLLIRVPHWKHPPGPLANFLPVLGSLLLFIDNPSHVMLTRISTKYEKIYRLVFCDTTFIVICDQGLLQEVFARDSVSGRSISTMDVVNQQGYAFTNEEFWRTQRAFVQKVLGALGLPRTAELKEFDRKASEAIGALVKELRGHNGSPVFLDEALCFALSNIFFSMIVGRTFDRDDKSFLSIINCSHANFRAMDPTSITNSPAFAQTPAYRNILRNVKLSKTHFIDYMTPIVQDHCLCLDRENPKDLIDHYLVQMGNGARLFKESLLLYSLLGDLYTASLECSAATIHWILLALIKYPLIQERIFQEIRKVTRGEREITVDDRPKMPYTDATVLEGYRFPSVLPFGVPRATSEDTIIEGYHIPKRATVVGLFWKFNRDPKLWNNPNCFDPHNHFDKYGTLVRRPYLTPFSVDRRNCIIETVANDIIFLIVVNLINNFVVLEDDMASTPNMDDSLSGVLRVPQPYKVRMVPRHPL